MGSIIAWVMLPGVDVWLLQFEVEEGQTQDAFRVALAE